jgi:mono/diheme cytochrome c family protein
VAREFTPQEMAALMWNHAPAMWTATAGRGYRRPVLTEEQAADLFAYFYAARYMERPGDAGRGKQLFAAKRCAGCHGISSAIAGGGPPVAEWPSLDEPIALADAMWNHAVGMRRAAAARNIALPDLTSQELGDILVYLQNLPQRRGRTADFSPASAETGEMLFRVKGCAECHQGKLSLSRVSGRTLTDFAAGMWNHAPKMGDKLPELRPEEMRRIVGYLWSIQFFGEKGDASRGKHVFTSKRCAACHGAAASGAPDLFAQKGNHSATSMMSALWQHGPAMLARMNMNKIAWPRFTGTEMADLIAYLNKS